MDAIERDNPSLRGVLPKVFAQEKLDKQQKAIDTVLTQAELLADYFILCEGWYISVREPKTKIYRIQRN